ncbi:MAG: bifunctional oligoribonuclease/PAP phosphatase NrnA, partial [Nitrospirae bacterium]|nr:bifunctional oligoribonuclease/PAP phosphatase NrnA [Nitrospirota bacterium]
MIPPADLLDFLRSEDAFVIAIHLNPDGDAIGSAIALSMALQKMGKKTVLLCRDSVPSQYRFLPGRENFYSFDNVLESGVRLRDFRNLILVDCNEISRTGMEKSKISDVTFGKSAVIDHHETEKAFGDIRWILPDIAATGMMIYYLIKALDIKITEAMAANLYAALVVDTGNFRFPNTTPEALSIAAELAGAGANPYMIYKEINESWTEGRFRLFMKVLNTLTIEDGIAITYVTRRMFEATSTSPDDTESFASVARVMRDIKVAVFLREIGDDNYKVSLRSSDDLNVADIAGFFGGGGHKNAAGCTIKAD